MFAMARRGESALPRAGSPIMRDRLIRKGMCRALRRSIEILLNAYPAVPRWAKLCRTSDAGEKISRGLPWIEWEWGRHRESGSRASAFQRQARERGGSTVTKKPGPQGLKPDSQPSTYVGAEPPSPANQKERV